MSWRAEHLKAGSIEGHLCDLRYWSSGVSWFGALTVRIAWNIKKDSENRDRKGHFEWLGKWEEEWAMDHWDVLHILFLWILSKNTRVRLVSSVPFYRRGEHNSNQLKNLPLLCSHDIVLPVWGPWSLQPQSPCSFFGVLLCGLVLERPGTGNLAES